MTSCYATPSFRLRSGLPLLVLSLLLAGCASTGSNGPERETRSTPSAPERMASQLDEMAPDARAREPAPPAPPELGAMLLDSAPQTTNRFDVAASDVELAQFLDDLSEVAQTNILLDSSVSGTVSLRLRDVTIRDVMQALQDQLGIAFERTDYGYRVSGDQLQTRMFRVNYLDIQRSGLSSTGIGGSQIGGGESQGQLSTRNETDFWGTLESTLGMMMGQGGDRQLVINRQTGLIVVKAPPSELRAISDFLYEAEIALQQQVIIEARVLEVRLSDTFESGIDWSILGQDVGDVSGLDIGAGVAGNTGANDPDLGGAFNLSLNLRNFNSVLSALRTQGEVEVLSSPRISTVNNQKAVIKVGSEEQFVNVSSVATTSDDGQQQINPNFSLQPYFSGIILDVTPQIAHDDQIILHVHPSVVQVTATSRTFTIQGESYNLPVASSSIRETDSVIRADNGQVVVIGGLLQNSITSLRSGLPGEGGGWLRRLLGQERTTNERTELIILLRPVIADADSFEEDIRNTSTRLLNR